MQLHKTKVGLCTFALFWTLPVISV